MQANDLLVDQIASILYDFAILAMSGSECSNDEARKAARQIIRLCGIKPTAPAQHQQSLI